MQENMIHFLHFFSPKVRRVVDLLVVRVYEEADCFEVHFVVGPAIAGESVMLEKFRQVFRLH